MTEESPLRPGLCEHQPADDIGTVQADWAGSHDGDVVAYGDHRPERNAAALHRAMPAQTGPILGYVCGARIPGAALRAFGADRLHGIDMSPEMRAHP